MSADVGPRDWLVVGLETSPWLVPLEAIDHKVPRNVAVPRTVKNQQIDAKLRRSTHCCNPVIDGLDHQTDVASFESDMLSSLGVIGFIEHVHCEGDRKVSCNTCPYGNKYVWNKTRPWRMADLEKD